MSTPETPQRDDKPLIIPIGSIDRSKVTSPALRRILDEVRIEDQEKRQLYDRVHNRHNRGATREEHNEYKKGRGEKPIPEEVWEQRRGGGYDRVHNRHNRGR